MTILTYSEWSVNLEKFASGDDSVLDIMNTSSLELNDGNKIRFLNLVNKVYVRRKNLWIEKLNNLFSSPINSIESLKVVIRNAKTNLNPLVSYINLNTIPEDAQKVLNEDLKKFIDDIKTNLRNNALKYNRTQNKEDILYTINTLEVNNYVKKISSTEISETTENLIEFDKKRKIIF